MMYVHTLVCSLIYVQRYVNVYVTLHIHTYNYKVDLGLAGTLPLLILHQNVNSLVLGFRNTAVEWGWLSGCEMGGRWVECRSAGG